MNLEMSDSNFKDDEIKELPIDTNKDEDEIKEVPIGINKDDDEIKEVSININNYILSPVFERCIYKVPKSIRKINEEAYTPQLISIGPLHHGKEELVDMEKQKTTYMKSFFERITIEKWEKMLTFVQNHEQQIRNCYAKSSKLESLEFVMMILYDAVFIIEIFWQFFTNDKRDILLKNAAIEVDLFEDLQLLENQLPYFVIQEIYNLAFGNPQNPNFMYVSHHCLFNNVFQRLPDQAIVKHFTDLKRSVLLQGYTKSELEGQIVDLPCAVKLHESGVKFRPIEQGCLVDIRFEKRKQRFSCFTTYELRIPTLEEYDQTESGLRNIMALEQCHYSDDPRVCDYVDLMDRLIDTEKDVELLVGEGIIFNYMGDNAEVANMFNKLCQQIVIDDSCYYNICKELKEHYDNPWNHAKATLKSVYFNNLWRGTATIGAIILLLLTVIQTICSILQVLSS